jgi:ABC-type oligopeptide transport system substrate-binding subunit
MKGVKIMTDLEKKLQELEAKLKAEFAEKVQELEAKAKKELAAAKAKYHEELQRMVNQANAFQFTWKHVLGALIGGAVIVLIVGLKVLGLIGG